MKTYLPLLITFWPASPVFALEALTCCELDAAVGSMPASLAHAFIACVLFGAFMKWAWRVKARMDSNSHAIHATGEEFEKAA